MLEHACGPEMAQNSINSVSLKFRLEILITCQNPELAHFFGSKILRWLKSRREIEFEAKMIRILSHLRIFKLKKMI